MPHLTFAASLDGLALSVLVGLDGHTMQSLQSRGGPIPAPLTARALIDTGSDWTAFSSSCLNRLGIAAANRVETQTAGGVVLVDVYKVSLSIGGPERKPGPTLVCPELKVTRLAHDIEGFDALIGLDVLAECLLIVDGPGRQFTLAF